MANNAIIRIDLLNLEQSINQPQLLSLLEDKWEIISSVPVSDNDNPYLLLIMAPPTKEEGSNYSLYERVVPVFIFVLILELAYVIIRNL
mgnify:CR=1 FL=1